MFLHDETPHGIYEMMQNMKSKHIRLYTELGCLVFTWIFFHLNTHQKDSNVTLSEWTSETAIH